MQRPLKSPAHPVIPPWLSEFHQYLPPPTRTSLSSGCRRSLRSCRRPTPTTLTRPSSTTRLMRPSGTWRRPSTWSAPPPSGSLCPGSTEPWSDLHLHHLHLLPPSQHRHLEHLFHFRIKKKSKISGWTPQRAQRLLLLLQPHPAAETPSGQTTWV